MCTAVTYQTADFYVGRTLDHTMTYGECVTLTPRRFPLPFRHLPTLETHHAILGMALVLEDYPLYFDALNDRGLAMAGLNFVGNAHYNDPVQDADNVAQFELIPWVLGQCATVEEAEALLRGTHLANTPFRDDLPPSQLHWMIAGHGKAITVEATRDGLHIYPNPVGVLTNNPPFPQQLFRLRDYMGLSPAAPENRFAPELELTPYSFGMGAMGLPGDLSSQSRFVRAAFTRLNSLSGDDESQSISQFFHILGAVAQPRGCTKMTDGSFEITLYTSCCNTDKGIYYYTTYENRQITGVDLHREDLEGTALRQYPLIQTQQINMQN